MQGTTQRAWRAAAACQAKRGGAERREAAAIARLSAVSYNSHMPKLFQIHEEDLADLERTLPQFADALMPAIDNRLRAQFRRIQAILSNVRWNYGPPSEVEIVPAGDDNDG